MAISSVAIDQQLVKITFRFRGIGAVFMYKSDMTDDCVLSVFLIKDSMQHLCLYDDDWGDGYKRVRIRPRRTG